MNKSESQNEIFTIDLDYCTFDQGSYGKIFLNEKENEIIKRLEWYYTEHAESVFILDTFTIRDLIYSIAVNDIIGCPKINTIKNIHDKYVDMYMPYYGITLNKWIQSEAYSHENCKKIIILLIETLIKLDNIGIQHTDIKPANIVVLYENNVITQVTLIDYNICSTQAYNDTLTRDYNWSCSFGTWVYTPPEICDFETPHTTTSSWYLGFIIFYLYTRGLHPSNFNAVEIHKYNNQNRWSKLLHKMKLYSSEYYPININIVAKLQVEIYELFLLCCAWNPHKRMTLKDLYSKLTNIESINIVTISKEVTFTPAPPNDNNNNNNNNNNEYVNRKSNFKLIYTILNKNDLLCLLGRSLTLYDLFSSHKNIIENKISKNEIIVASIAISYIIDSEYFYSSFLKKSLMSQFILNESSIFSNILKLGNLIGWDCYYVCPIYLIDAANIKINYINILKTFIEMTEPYKISNIIEKLQNMVVT